MAWPAAPRISVGFQRSNRVTDPVRPPVDAKFERALLELDSVTVAGMLASAGPLTPGLLDEMVVPALIRIGAAWDRDEIPLSQLFLSARLAQREVLAASPGGRPVRDGQPRLAIGILEDSHVLGKEIVLSMVRSAGYEISDWGARLSPSDIELRVNQEGTQVLFLSVLMLRAAMAVAHVRAALDRNPPRPAIIVGGAPYRFDPRLGGEVGADFAATTASDALEVLVRIPTAAGVPIG